jgi:hypothetical protein
MWHHKPASASDACGRWVLRVCRRDGSSASAPGASGDTDQAEGRWCRCQAWLPYVGFDVHRGWLLLGLGGQWNICTTVSWQFTAPTR